jgi:DNA-binding NarL/FixJ family response regulator
MTTRVAVADDHAVVREGLRSLLGAVDGFELVGSVGTAGQAVRVAVTERPDVLVLDLGLPDGSGIDVAREVGRLAPEVGVLMLTMYDDDDSVFAAMRAGAMGYVLKGADPDDVIRAIQAVAAGHAILGPGVAGRALAYLSAPRPDEPAFPALTAREREVLDLIAGGLGNATIAARLGVASSTVGNHVTSIFAKLHVASRAEAIVRAREAGLGD